MVILQSAWKIKFNNSIPVGIYLLKVEGRNTRARREICSKLTIKISERLQCRWSAVFIVNFEHTLQFVLKFLLLTLSRQMLIGMFLLVGGRLLPTDVYKKN